MCLFDASIFSELCYFAAQMKTLEHAVGADTMTVPHGSLLFRWHSFMARRGGYCTLQMTQPTCTQRGYLTRRVAYSAG